MRWPPRGRILASEKKRMFCMLGAGRTDRWELSLGLDFMLELAQDQLGRRSFSLRQRPAYQVARFLPCHTDSIWHRVFLATAPLPQSRQNFVRT